MKKKIALIAVVCTLVLTMVGCTTTKTVTITDENGNTTTTEVVNGVESVYYENISMTVVNDLGGDLAELYVCLTGEDDWGENLVIDGTVFPADKTLEGYALTYSEGDTLDVLMVDENGEELSIEGIDLSPAEGKTFNLVLGYDEDEDAFFAYVEQQ